MPYIAFYISAGVFIIIGSVFLFIKIFFHQQRLFLPFIGGILTIV